MAQRKLIPNGFEVFRCVLLLKYFNLIFYVHDCVGLKLRRDDCQTDCFAFAPHRCLGGSLIFIRCAVCVDHPVLQSSSQWISGCTWLVEIRLMLH